MSHELFSGTPLSSHLAARTEAMTRAIASYDSNRLLNTNIDDLVLYFAATAAIEPVAIGDDVTLSQEETTTERRNLYGFPGQQEQYTVAATRLTLHVPYSGDPNMTSYVPSTRTYSPPEGECRGGELLLSIVVTGSETKDARRQLESMLNEARRYMSWISTDIAAHNRAVTVVARQEVEARRSRLLENQKLATTLGFPIRARDSAPQTYAIPDVRRRALPTPPPASSASYAPEPALDDATYERILEILGNMVRVMEQSPGAFSEMKEEDLRTHFLVQLNGQFEGRASAETFRGAGSTDILLVERDKSAFVAECKFWDGPATLTGAIDQLLDYATWRDAKAAILIFSRRGDFGAVVEAVPATLAGHAQSVGEVKRLAETMFRSRLRQRDDPNRLIVLTTGVYNIPIKPSVSKRLAAGKRTAPKP